ncbi:hypothetical protein BJ322DRAFT_522590 [Thelephora terrestris]|uniref:RRM domain-containing protein n=1 Tax=Thelephora terrestris TaxID=56493 RepID=A0A9P6LAA3_9AGAM|nr:hypothetical protein BJ322DRAFT_522590 [Thelephora terrestris]
MKRRRLEADPSTSDVSRLSPSSSEKGKKLKPPNDGADGKSLQTDKDFEEYQKVMQPRTVKGPSWANEEQLRPQTTGKRVGVKDDHIDANPAPSQQALSDLDWMRQRMANSTVEEPDTATHLSDPPTKTKIETHQPEASSSDPARDTILQTARLFFRNLAYSCTVQDLTELFKPFGEISQIALSTLSTR